MTDDAITTCKPLHPKRKARRAASTYQRLAPKHRAFVDAYVRSWNPAEAAVAAGYAESSAKRHGYRLVHRPDIFDAVIARQEWFAAECQAVIDVVFAAVSSVLGPSIVDYVTTDDDGRPFLDFTKLTREQLAAAGAWIDR